MRLFLTFLRLSLLEIGCLEWLFSESLNDLNDFLDGLDHYLLGVRSEDQGCSCEEKAGADGGQEL
jgi:hypothetical protein